MADNHLQLAIILGSTREGRFGPKVAHWFADQASSRPELSIDLIDLAEAGLPDRLSAAAPPPVAALTPRLRAAEAFVVVTPEYNHSFPGGLKNAIDWYYSEWQAKPVGFVSYGGISGGLRAVEQLRQVFAELHAVTVRNSVSFHRVHEQFSGDGVPKDGRDANLAAQAMLGQILWWGRALRHARELQPYKF
jgi:NAD(P)H-dependent FMN reductase